MRLTRIEISNYSRIANLGVDIRGHAVIVGANDVGKTSMLRALHLLLGCSTAQLFQQLDPVDLADRTETLLVEVRFGVFSDAERILFPREISIDAQQKTESLRVQLRVAVDPEDDEVLAVRRWFPEAGHDRAPTREQLRAFGWRYIPASRGSTAQSLDGPSSALRALLTAIDLGAEKQTLTELLNTFNDQLGASVKIGELRDSVASHLSKAMPKKIDREDLSVRTAADPEDGVLGQVSMFVKRGDDHVPLADQSDGVRQLMALTLIDLAEDAAHVIAVDEPELHLHPSSQRTVAELFRTARNQKILVTHSPYIVQRFEPSQVITVNPDGMCHQVSAAHLSVVEKQRANWWAPGLLEALTARFVLIVEGLSDRIVVEASARELGIDLDRLGAVVFALDGADKFTKVNNLIGKDGFCVNILGLVDDAEKGPWVGSFDGSPGTVIGKKVFVSTPDIEAEYCTALTGPEAALILVKGGVCSEAGIKQACGVTNLADITIEAVAGFCRKNKVTAAVAVAAALDPAAAAKIASVGALLSELRQLAPA